MGKSFKNVKIFDTGKFPQGEFNAERVEDIFNRTKDSVTAQFCHTSKVKGANKKPLDMGEFSGFRLEDGSIYADIDFNDDGEFAYEKGMVNACSVEISENEIVKVAILPINEKPQILSAEFDSNGTMIFGAEMEFAEEIVLTAAQIIEGIKTLDMATVDSVEFSNLQDIVWEKGDEQYAVNKLTANGYEVKRKISEFANLSPEDIEKTIKARITAEFSAKEAGLEFFNKLKSEGKITPAMEEKGFNAEFASMLVHEKSNNKIVEFSNVTHEFAALTYAILESLPGKNISSRADEFAEPKGTGELTPSEQLKAAGLTK